MLRIKPSSTRAISRPRTTGSPPSGPDPRGQVTQVVIGQNGTHWPKHKIWRLVRQALGFRVERVVPGDHLLWVGERHVGGVSASNC